MNLVLERPGIYPSVTAKELEMNLGVEVTENVICKVLKQVVFLRQDVVHGCFVTRERTKEDI